MTGPRTGFEDDLETLVANDSPETEDARGVVFLVRTDGGVRSLDVPVGGTIRVGRSRDCEVVVESSLVSRVHAKLCVFEDRVEVTDLESRNGTFVGGRRLRNESVALQGGESVRVPGCEIIVAAIRGMTPRPQEGVLETGFLPGVFVHNEQCKQVFEFARKIARSEATTLILGETGVGKDVLARQIHAWSTRSLGPFLRLNCAALPETLLESELFGHERGAFTGADKSSAGYFESARGGTLFIDEIGEMSQAAQVKLLNVLELRSVQRIGSRKETPVDVRVIAATHRDLRRWVAEGRFREDLFYRLSTFDLTLPPLRERRDEIGVLAKRLLAEIKPEARIDDAALRTLEQFSWPGNVRQLRNAIEHAAILAEGNVVGREHLPPDITGLPRAGRPSMIPQAVTEESLTHAPPPVQGPPSTDGAGMRAYLEDMERNRIIEALAAEAGNRTKAAERLGLPRRTLVYKLRKLGISDDD